MAALLIAFAIGVVTGLGIAAYILRELWRKIK
jgi:hypothetical protein